MARFQKCILKNIICKNQQRISKKIKSELIIIFLISHFQTIQQILYLNKYIKQGLMTQFIKNLFMNENPEEISAKKKSNYLSFPMPAINRYTLLENIEAENYNTEKSLILQKNLHPDQSNYLCPLCLNYFIKPVSTICSHTFCDMCLSEYLIFFNSCLICQKNLRNTKMSYSILLDQLVNQFIQKIDKQEMENYKKRHQIQKNWIEQKRLKHFDVGTKIDVRDGNYVWCSAIITKITNKYNQANRSIRIHYNGFSHKFDEQLDIHSVRLASYGFYSSRKDIPRYYMKKGENLHSKKLLITTDKYEDIFLSKIESDDDD